MGQRWYPGGQWWGRADIQEGSDGAELVSRRAVMGQRWYPGTW